MRLLLSTSDHQLHTTLARLLHRANYLFDSVTTAADTLAYAETGEYDGLLLDNTLAENDSLAIIAQLRQEHIATPALLFAESSRPAIITALDAGADDYLVKPFDFNELLARVRAIVRRGGERAGNVMTSGDLTLDSASRTVTRGGQEIKLTAKEFDILEYLMQNQGRVLSRDKLSNHIWNYDYDGGSNVIDVYMYHLRRKIDRDFDEKKIQTVKGAGYMIK